MNQWLHGLALFHIQLFIEALFVPSCSIKDVSEISIQGHDEKRNVTFWNHASEKLYGYTEKEALGKKLEDLIIPFGMQEEVKRLHHRWIVYGEKIPAGELVLRDKNGNDVYVFSSHVMHETSKGKEIFCIDVDMNSIRRVEEEQKKLRSELRQSQKMESIGTLAGGIAHDFNNILQAISGYSEMLFFEKAKDDPDYSSLVEIYKATQRAGELIRQLLLFSRKAETRKKPVKINNEIEQAKSILEKIIPKMIKIETHLAKDLWNANVDPIHIEQVILNMGSNSADAMPDGGKIFIKTENASVDHNYHYSSNEIVPGDYVLITVSDIGYGMDKETLDKIFEPFFTTKDEEKGTGLGLASAYGIVKEHGGHITCGSRLGQGTSFKIYLPALKQNVNNPNNVVKKMKGGNETILIVDDEPSLRDFASAALKRFGYSILTCENGEQALKVYSTKKHDIQLIILDVNMPGMGGHQCLKQLLELNPFVKVSNAHSDRYQSINRT